MKTIFYTFLFILLTTLAYSQTAKSIIVEYDVDHYGVKHKQVLFSDDFGKKKVVDVHNPNNTTKRYLSLNGMDYTFMLEHKNLNFKYPSKKNDLIYHVYDMGTLTDHEFYVKVEKTGEEKVLDKECDVYIVTTADKVVSRYYIWKGILLKKESKPSNLIALKIDENPVFEKGIFEIPEGCLFKY